MMNLNRSWNITVQKTNVFVFIFLFLWQRPPSGGLSFSQQDDALSTRSGDTPGPNSQSNPNSSQNIDNSSEAGEAKHTAFL